MGIVTCVLTVALYAVVPVALVSSSFVAMPDTYVAWTPLPGDGRQCCCCGHGSPFASHVARAPPGAPRPPPGFPPARERTHGDTYS